MSEEELNLRFNSMAQGYRDAIGTVSDRCAQLAVALAMSNKERDEALARVAELEKQDAGHAPRTDNA